MHAKLSLAAALIAGGTSIVTHAEETIQPVVVTATRTAQTVDATLAPVTVLTRSDIEQSQARSLIELFAGLPGVQVNNNGGYGKTSSVHLRGTNANHVLVLVDGMRIGSATLGSVAFEDIPLEAIERIEIVRGPRSSLYGADAIGGVIQIFTRRGSGAPRLRAAVGAGSHNTARYSAGVGGAAGDTRYDLDVSRFRSGGFDSRDDNDPDHDGYLRNAVNARLEHAFSADNSVSLSALRSSGRNDYDGWNASNDYYAEFVQHAYTARWDISPTALWHSTLSTGQSGDEQSNYTNDVKSDVFRTHRTQWSWQNDIQATDTLLLTLGADHLTDTVSGTTSYAEDARDNTGVFTQGQWNLGRHDWLLGLRRDDNESYGQHTTGNLAWGYGLGNGARLTAGYGTAFKAPTFNDLYYQDPWGSNGNPNLKPEQANSREIGIQQHLAHGQWQVRAYRTDVADLIQWVEVASWVWQPQNVGSARIDGIEFNLSGQYADWDLGFTLDLTDARDRDTNLRLATRAHETARLDVGHQDGRLHTTVSWLAVGSRYADTANTQEMAGYGVVNVALRYDVAADWRLEAKVDNLLDHDYQQVRGYNTGGRMLFVGVNYQP